jgi:F-type H+-transporting ATPase subunit epsilon
MATQSSGGGDLRVVVISPERTVYDGSADSVVAPAWDGELGILRGHAPLMAILGEGPLRVRQGEHTQRFHVKGGFLQVIDNVVTVLSEEAGSEVVAAR